MPWSARIFVIAIVLFTIWLIFFEIVPSQETNVGPAVTLVTNTQGENNIMDVLVLDSNEKTGARFQDLVNGEDAAIVYIAEGNLPKVAIAPVSEPLEAYSFSRLSELVKFDLNKNGYIDATDPVYRNLYLALYNRETNVIHYRPIQEAGIAALILNQRFLVAERRNDASRYQMVAGVAIMADDSRWNMNLIPVKTSMLSNVSLIKYR